MIILSVTFMSLIILFIASKFFIREFIEVLSFTVFIIAVNVQVWAVLGYISSRLSLLVQALLVVILAILYFIDKDKKKS